MLSDAAMRQRMENGWIAGKPETVCGNGSMMANTANIRRWLPEIALKYDLRTINDAGAGDLNWIKKVKWPWMVDYRAFDLIPRIASVSKADITVDVLPKADAILCRMVLNHLLDDVMDESRIDMALDRFKESARYLIATHYVGDLIQRTPQFSRLDLTARLGDPLDSVQDGHEDNCRLALWKL